MSVAASRWSTQMLPLCVVVLLMSSAAGCWRSDFPMVRVSGRVTFDGGQCPAPGSVTFQPLEIPEGLPKRPATGHFGKDGRFTVNAFSDERGVLPGRYKVEVTCFAGAPDASKPDPWADVDYIADEYEPEVLTVKNDSSHVQYDIDVPRRKR